MTHPNITYVRARDCFKSPLNVRTQTDEAADAELEANIGETGLVLQNLIGVKVPRQRGKFEIYGGGRRLDGVHRNIDSGKLLEDFMVPVLVLKSADEAIQMSLAENYYNLRMNPADECRAFQAIIEREHKTPAELAKRLGVTEKFVLGRLRLASLAECVFEALRTGAITLDVAKAYASTADTERQAKVFETLETAYYGHNVNEIRRSLATGTYTGNDPKALFVGREAYEGAGGRIDGDLFSDLATEVWRDGEILEQLAEARLAEAAAAVREREGLAEVRTIAATKVPYSETFQLARVTGTPIPLSDAAEARKAEIEAEIAGIEAAADEFEDYTEEQSRRLEALEDELGGIVEERVIVGPEDRAAAIAYLVIGNDGQPILHEQLYALPADASAENCDDDQEEGEASHDAEDDADRAPAAETYSQRLRDELATMKTELLALHVAKDPKFALDLGTFIMVDDACRIGHTAMPSELRAKEAPSRVAGFESDTPAARAWGELDQALDRSWVDHREIHQRYDAFCAMDDAARAAWLGWAIARTLHAVPDGQAGSGFLSHLGARLGIDVAAWWRPTARNFFDRLTKPAILSLFDAIGGAGLRSRYAAARKFDLVVSAEKLFGGEIIADADVKERALAWVPAAMQFECANPPTIDERDRDSDTYEGIEKDVGSQIDGDAAGAADSEGVALDQAA